jgi:uncharacterized protein YeaO (DUF488 family)
MAIRVVRLGTPRLPGEGVRLGTVRRPPRGVPKQDFTKRDYFDVWLPELAPSAPLIGRTLPWARFVKQYRREMAKPAARHLLATLAALSSHTDFSVGCYCADETKCHRSLLRELLLENGATLVG